MNATSTRAKTMDFAFAERAGGFFLVLRKAAIAMPAMKIIVAEMATFKSFAAMSAVSRKNLLSQIEQAKEKRASQAMKISD